MTACGADGRARRDPGARLDDRRRVHAGADRCRRVQYRRHLRVGRVGVAADELRQRRLRGHVGRDDHARSRGFRRAATGTWDWRERRSRPVRRTRASPRARRPTVPSPSSVAPVRRASSERDVGTGRVDGGGRRRRRAAGGRAASRRYLSASALITLSVMSIRWLAKTTGSCRIRSNFSASAICWMTLFARSWTLASSSLRRRLRSSRNSRCARCQVARQVGEVALLVAALGLGHRRAVLLEERLQIAHLLAELLDVGVARGELLLELLLRALRRRRLAEQALGVDEADLVVGGLRRRRAEREQRGEAEDGARKAVGAAVQVILLRDVRIPSRPGTGTAGSCRAAFSLSGSA